MLNKNLKTLSNFLRKEKVSIVLGVGLGVVVTVNSAITSPSYNLSNKSTVTVEAVDAELLADNDVRSSLSNTTIPSEDDLSKVESAHVTLNTRDKLVATTGYVALIQGASLAEKQYTAYVKEQERLAKEAEKKRLAEEAEKKRLAEEEEKKSSSSSANVSHEGNKYTGVFEVTGYCNCRLCCGQYSPEVTGRTPHTASGTVPCAGRTVAVDPNVIPLGSTVVINGHSYIAEDTGSAVKGNVIDVFYDSHSDALNWGRRSVEVTYYIK